MSYISQITVPNGTTYQVRPYTESLSSANLNTITNTGFYKVTSTCTNSKYTNATLIVTAHTSGCTQVETDISTGAVAVRSYTGSAWTDWKELSSTLVATYDSNGNVTISPFEVVADGDNSSY